jgi:hypothetical protein
MIRRSGGGTEPNNAGAKLRQPAGSTQRLHTDEIEVILDQSLQRERLCALGRLEVGVEIDTPRVLDDQAAVAEHRAIVILDEWQLAFRAAARVAGGNNLIGQPGQPEPRLELEGERADVASKHRRELMEPDHRRCGDVAQDSLRPISAIASSSSARARRPSS